LFVARVRIRGSGCRVIRLCYFLFLFLARLVVVFFFFHSNNKWCFDSVDGKIPTLFCILDRPKLPHALLCEIGYNCLRPRLKGVAGCQEALVGSSVWCGGG